MLYLCPRPSKKNRDQMLKGILPDALREYGERTYNYAAVDKLRSYDFEERVHILDTLFTHPGKSILDVGTSSGSFMEIALRHGWLAKGLEPFPDDVKVCREKGLDVIQGLAEALPYPDNSFDVVHTSHVFEHLEDPLQAAREAYRVLKPGGLLFIEVPNQLDNFGFHRDMLFRNVSQRKRDIASIHHLWFFGRKTLFELYNRAAFTNIRIVNKHHKPFGGWRLPFSLISRGLSNLFYGTYIIRGFGFKPKN
ncbi:MAG: class I SAM-dependent methyltransferase [Cyclobacteriaceae bacterium]|nr:class I SAM-dependent methyltransferase [Cyclobacteriaceae bacterium]